MVEKNRYIRDWMTDIDTLLDFNLQDGTCWTAPRWLTQGDILFFYHTVAAKHRVNRLLKQAKQLPDCESRIINLLEHAADLANMYSGTIFSCALVSSQTEYIKDEENVQHFKSRIFAPMGQVHIFNSPLHADNFKEFVKIGQNVITPLFRKTYESIKQRLAEHNKLPDFLYEASVGESGFRYVNQDNWPSISSIPSARFIYEIQLREYLLDFILNELKDTGTPLLQECQCSRGVEKTGIVDYFIKLHGKWMPIEAKLNILSESDILSQIGKYMHIDSFTPTKGLHTNEIFKVNDSPICLVMDQSGIYISSDDKFINCVPGEPVWKREELDHNIISVIRNHFSNLTEHTVSGMVHTKRRREMATEAESLDAMRGKVESYMRQKQIGYEVSPDGLLFIKEGSTAVEIDIYKSGDYIFARLSALAAYEITKITPELTNFLLEKNRESNIGKFSLDTKDKSIWCEHELIGEFMNADELCLALVLVAGIADEHDEKISEMAGGKRAMDV